MGVAVKKSWLDFNKFDSSGALAQLPPGEGEELRRLCMMYESAMERGNLDQARHVRAGISDLVDGCCRANDELRVKLRILLGFAVDPEPTALDQ